MCAKFPLLSSNRFQPKSMEKLLRL
jgi:hypothetical protein